MPSLAIAFATLLGGCDTRGVAPVEAEAVFTVSNGVIHDLHLEALGLPAWPATYEMACPEGGRVSMTSEIAATGEPVQLFHVLVGCSAEGWTFDGPLDYLDISFCSSSSATYSITGELEVAGLGDCAIEATETCGAVTSARSCGVQL